jgi:3-oxoacyl-[acyl-carrier protein] reductase
MNVLITGASGGIGGRLAREFAGAGYDVALHCHRGKSAAESVRDDLAQRGARAEVFEADLSDPQQARALPDRVVEKWGRLDGLINNAGTARDRSLLKMSVEEWRAVLDVNLSGAFWCLQSAARHMARQKSGFIINVGSVLALKGAVGCANYVASKAGMLALTKSAALELGRYDIRVNAVLPGFHPTSISQSIPSDQVERVKAQHVLNRTTDLGDLAKLVLMVAENRSVSGQVFNADSRLI